jgi:hypothetical protein
MRKQFVVTLWLVVFSCWLTSAVRADLPPDPAELPKLWLESSPEQRIHIAEQIGEEGARQYARSQGWEPIFDGKGRTVPQGFDMVYRDPRTGKIIVLEAKGGTSPLGRGYGHLQGTRSWAVSAAEQVLHNPATSAAEKEAAKSIIEAARNSQLEVRVVRTEHVLGSPKNPVVEKVFQNASDELVDLQKAKSLADEVARKYRLPSRSGEVRGSLKEALEEKADDVVREGLREVRRASANASKVFEQMRTSVPRSSPPRGAVGPTSRSAAIPPKDSMAGMSSATRGAASSGTRAVTSSTLGTAQGVPRGALASAETLLGPALLAFDAGVRLAEAHQLDLAYQRGGISREERDKGKARLTVGFFTSNAGALGAGYAGASAGAAVGTMIFPGVGTFVGGIIGGIIGGFAGYSAGEAVAQGLVQ